jgi:hypothetical protein
MVANLSDVLTPDIVSSSDFVNTEYLQTLVVIVPKYVRSDSSSIQRSSHSGCHCRNLEESWQNEYHTIGDQIAEYGPKGSRGAVRGSPVVPGSSRKLLEEGDACVYSVTVLKGQYTPGRLEKDGTFEQGAMHDYIEDFKLRAREKRFVVRDFSFDASSHASNEEAIAELEVEVDRLWSGLVRWCKAHFGETFIAWMHVKMIRVFVESVLRYGLPVNFVVLMYRVRSLHWRLWSSSYISDLIRNPVMYCSRTRARRRSFVASSRRSMPICSRRSFSASKNRHRVRRRRPSTFRTSRTPSRRSRPCSRRTRRDRPATRTQHSFKKRTKSQAYSRHILSDI